MKAGSFGVTGFEAIDRKLAGLQTGFGGNALRSALIDAGEVIAAEARRLVPVFTGNLRDSIIVTFDAPNYARVAGDAPGMTVYVGPEQGRDVPHDGFYGHMIELGTIHSAAHPFMRPALDAKKAEAQGILRMALLTDLKGRL